MIDDYVKVVGYDGLVRDVSSMAVINTNENEYLQYTAKRNAALQRQNQIDRHEQDINSIRQDVAEIKAILLSIAQR